MEHVGEGGTNCNWCIWNDPQKLGKGAKRFGNWRSSGANKDDSIVEICCNTEKSPGDLRILAVTQTPVKTII